MVNARKSFDEKAFHDLKDIARFNSIYTALRAGKYDYFLRNLEDMKQMTGAELKEAFDLKDDREIAILKKPILVFQGLEASS